MMDNEHLSTLNIRINRMENRASQFISINEKKGTPDNPLVNIITPVFNGIKYLEMCIQSVLNQSYSYIEHIFVDGEAFEGEGEEKEIVVTEIDATMLHSQEKGRKKLTVKLGVMYSGKELEGETAKYKRYQILWHSK